MNLQLPKGTRDFPPEENILRDKIINILKKNFEIYGFSPLDTPTFERLDVMTAKFGAGENADATKEIFKIQDQGGRELGLRYELTFALARFIGMNPNTKMPFKRYQIGKVFRDGPIKLGRYREFYQCDIDTVGSSSMLADAEILLLVKKIFEELEMDIEIEINNRKILNNLMEVLKIENKDQTLIIIDKLKKQGLEQVKKELEEIDLTSEQINELTKIITIKGTNKEKLNNLKKILTSQDGINEIEEILKITGEKSITFNPSMVRGLAYYTGPIFEVFLKKSEITSSIAGGGRWDKMIGNYLENKQEYPATGIAFGLEPITESIKLKNPELKKTVTKVYIIPIQTKCNEILQKLRENNISTDIDLMNRSITKNLDYADKLKIPYVIIIGKKEFDEKKYKLKNMQTGEEKELSIGDLIKCLK